MKSFFPAVGVFIALLVAGWLLYQGINWLAQIYGAKVVVIFPALGVFGFVWFGMHQFLNRNRP